MHGGRPRRVRLRVAPEHVDVAAKPEPLDDRLDRRHQPAGDEQLRVRVRSGGERRASEAELEPVGLVLVAAEEQDRAALGRVLGRREALNVDRVVEDLPGPAGSDTHSSADRLQNSLW